MWTPAIYLLFNHVISEKKKLLDHNEFLMVTTGVRLKQSRHTLLVSKLLEYSTSDVIEIYMRCYCFDSDGVYEVISTRHLTLVIGIVTIMSKCLADVKYTYQQHIFE